MAAFRPFSDKIRVFCVGTRRTSRLLPVTRSAPRYGEKWDTRVRGGSHAMVKMENKDRQLLVNFVVDLNVESICSQMGILGSEDVSEV